MSHHPKAEHNLCADGYQKKHGCVRAMSEQTGCVGAGQAMASEPQFSYLANDKIEDRQKVVF